MVFLVIFVAGIFCEVVMGREQGFYWVDLGEPVGKTIGYWLPEADQWLIDGGIFSDTDVRCIGDKLICPKK